MGEDFADGTDRDNGGLGLGVAEDTGGDTAQRDAGGPQLLGGEQAGSVGGGQEHLMLWGRLTVHDRSDGVDDLGGRQVVAPGHRCCAGRFGAVPRGHDVRALLAQPGACGRVDGVVDAGVQRLETSEESGVRRVDDRVGPDRCDVAAPQRQARVHLRSRQAEGVDGFSLGRLGGQEPLQ